MAVLTREEAQEQVLLCLAMGSIFDGRLHSSVYALDEAGATDRE